MAYFTDEEIAEILNAVNNATGHTTYVGARYVPIFGRVGESSAEWDNTAPYEPLTIVTYEGDSYTSRQYVPTGVAITNEDFWANTGNYNSQIEQYRNDVARLSDAVENFQSDLDGISSMLPSTSFTTENTVEDAIESVDNRITQESNKIEALENALPIEAFSETTVSTAISENDERITTLENKAYADITKYGAVSGSYNNDWQSIFDACIAACNAIHFPAGMWYIQNAYDITECKQISADSPIIFTTENAHLNIVTPFNNRAALICGVCFLGNGIAKTAIKTTSTNGMFIVGCSFIDFTGVAIDSTNTLGLCVMNCLFDDNHARNEDIDYRMEGIVCTTDAFISNCKFFHQKKCITLSSNCNVTNCYFYCPSVSSFYSRTRESYGISSNSQWASDIIINGCEFDTIQFCICCLRRSIIKNNRFMWDSAMADVCSIFYNVKKDTGAVLYEVDFSSNIILGASSDKTEPHTIQMFYLGNNVTSASIYCYKSAGNLYGARGSQNESIKLFAGFKTNGGALDSATSWIHITNAFPTVPVDSTSPRITLRNNGFGGTSIAIFGSRSGMNGISNIISGLNNPVAGFNAGFSDGIYLRGTSYGVIGDIENYTGRILWYEFGTYVDTLPSGVTEINKPV